MWRTGVVALFAALCVSEPALAQNARITGTVRAADGSGPVMGAGVTISRTNRGTVSRDDGRYTISALEAGAYVVVARRIGYAPDSQTVRLSAGATAIADFNLKVTAAQIGGVVITGYGGVKDVRDRTGLVEMVKEKDFNTGRVIGAQQLIQAKIPGVQVMDNNEPGGGMSLRIRGGTSVNASNEPLIVIDGVPLSIGGGVSSGRNPLNFLNPADIASITVLKDASSTAIYGSRGANGVILITTKSGITGESAVTYSSNYSTSSIVKKPNVLNATQYRAAVQQYAPQNIQYLGNANTNWIDAVTQAAGGAEQNLSIGGGKDDMHYRLSLGSLNQTGILKGSITSRASMALTYSDILFGDRLEFRANLKGSKADDNYAQAGIGGATAMGPTQPIKNADGSWFQWTDWLGPGNPLADQAMISDHGTVYRTVGNIEAKYSAPWIEGLTATVRTGYDFTQSSRATFSPSTSRYDLRTSRGGRIDKNNPRQTNTLLELFGTYTRKLAGTGSTFDVTGGYTYENSRGDYPSFYAEGLSTDLLSANGVPGAKTQQNFLTVDESKLISFFGRANFTQSDKYLLTASVRRDGSSRFGAGNQWGVFPSMAGAWRIIEEPFMQNIPKLSDLKLRASWGVNGNQSFGNYLFLSTYTAGDSKVQYPFGSTWVTTIRPSAVDPGIKWEQTASTNFGVDYGFYNNRITGTIDWYTKTTKDLLFRVPVAQGTNLGDYVMTNIGSMKNTGIELGISGVVFDGKTSAFRWDASLTASHNVNKITAISAQGSDKLLWGPFINGGVGNQVEVLKPGLPINTFYVFQHKVGSDGKPVGGAATDIQMYVDQNKDGAITVDDKIPFHSPAPNWIIGHTSTMSYKNWDASLTARASLGNYAYNNVASSNGTYRSLVGNQSPPNLEASVLKYGFTATQYFSDLYVEKASFLRLDNISVGYRFKNVPQIKSVRVYGAIQNVFTSTKYTGVDPAAAALNSGVDNNLYPLSRTFTFGLNLGF